MGTKMHNGASPPLYGWARELREKATPAEEILWNYLKTKPYGIKFRRQHPYSDYILDFFAFSLKLVIEVDGSIHDLKEVKEKDKIRQEFLEKNGLTVVRIMNEEILHHPDDVHKFINATIEKLINERK